MGDQINLPNPRKSPSVLNKHGIVRSEGSQAQLLQTIPSSWDVTESVNLRDVGIAAGGHNVASGRVFRSSQVVSTRQLSDLQIKTVIDLRQAPVACKTQPKNMAQAISHAFTHFYSCCTSFLGVDDEDEEIQIVPSQDPCWRCTDDCDGKYGCTATVYHVDVLPTTVSLHIFAALPAWLQGKVVSLAIRRKNPEPVVAAAVADPNIMGYFRLYKIILDKAKRHVAQALKLFADRNNYPLLVHCIHGKDRTGLIIMLLYHICGVPEDVIIRDYSHSESLLREGRENRLLFGIAESMTTDQVIAAAEHVMKSTIMYVVDKYGSIERYCMVAGVTRAELEAIRRNMTAEAVMRNPFE